MDAWSENKTYEQIEKSISKYDLSIQISNLKKQNLWLGDVNSQFFQGMNKRIKSAFTRFFEKRMVFLNLNKEESNLVIPDATILQCGFWK